MTINGIKPDDVVLVDIRGERFYALVLRLNDGAGKHMVDRLNRSQIRHATTRQIIGHWRQSRRKARAA